MKNFNENFKIKIVKSRIKTPDISTIEKEFSTPTPKVLFYIETIKKGC